MTDYEKGEYVRTVGSGTGRQMRGYGYIQYTKGDELVITSITPHGLRVRKASGGNVFVIARANVERYTRQLGEVPEGGILPDDPRVAWIFEDAGRLADRLGYCRVYDRIVNELGVPGRERTFTIKMEVAEGIEVVAKVDARSKRLAETKLRDLAGLQPSTQLRVIEA